MRKKIFEIVEISDGKNRISTAYDYFMIGVIVLSLIPLAFKTDNAWFDVIDGFCVTVFILDYILRLLTADFKYDNHSPKSFFRYPFSFLAIVDFLSILPSITPLSSGFKLLKIFRMIRALRVFRVFRGLRYSKSFGIIVSVLRNSKDALIAVCALAGGYILISALVIFNVEPDSFPTFFDAIYWATVSLTTVGYGDIYPVTTIGRIVTMVSSVFGIAIVALPAGIITAGYMTEIDKTGRRDEDETD